jgi:hypothetical protein
MSTGANHQYSLEIPDPGAQSFACYAITARVRAHARRCDRTFLHVAAGWGGTDPRRGGSGIRGACRITFQAHFAALPSAGGI